jgi:hypothetical protein
MTERARAWSHGLALGVLAAGVTAVYASSLGADLVFDSRVLVLENPAIRELTSRNTRAKLVDAAARMRRQGAQLCPQKDAAVGRRYSVGAVLSASTSAMIASTSRTRRIPRARSSASAARAISRAAAVHCA